MLEKSSKIGHSIGEKKSIFRKKDSGREAKNWAKKGGPSCTNLRIESIDFVPEPGMANHGHAFWRNRPPPTLEQNPNTDPKTPYMHTRS